MADGEVTPLAVTDDFTDLYRATYDDGLLGVVANKTFSSTGVGGATADGTAHAWSGNATFVTVAGGSNADGNAGAIFSSAVFEHVAGGSDGTGSSWTIIVNQADAIFRVLTPGSPTGRAGGRNSVIYTALPILEGEAFSVTEASALIAQDPFRAPNIEVKSGVSIKFDVVPWRVRQGIPLTEATCLAVQPIEASIGVATSSAPFVTPAGLGQISTYRWLAGDFVVGQNWLPMGSAPGPQAARSWAEAADQFNWYSAALRSWAQLAVDTADSSVPQWVQGGTDNPVKSATYTYWRVDQYVTNTALLCNDTVTMDMLWTPPADAMYQPVTITVVLVPRMPTGGSYYLMRMGPDISLELNDNSTIDLVLGGERVTIDTVGSRVRSNEPIVVSAQLLPNERKVMTGVMDSMIRVKTTQVSQALAMDPTKWKIGDQSGFEILEVDMYRAYMSERQLASTMSVFDRCYGVTL